MSQQVYYNYDKNIVQGISGDSLSKPISAKYASKISNIKHNEVPYFLQNIYFYKPPSSAYVWLVLQNTSDPNMASGNNLFLAIKLSSGSPTTTDLDAFVSAAGSSRTTNPELNLNQYLVDGDDAIVNTDTATKTTTVIIKKPIGVKSSLSNKTFYTTPIAGISDLVDVNDGNRNATISKTILDWSISCELEGEDSATEEATATKMSTSGLMDNINMAMAFMLVIGGAYIAAPEIYGWVILEIVKSHGTNTPEKPIASLNLFWLVVFGFIFIQLIVLGASGTGASFYLLGIGLFLLIFVINKSLADTIGLGKSLLQTDKIQYHNETIVNDIGWFSIFKPAEGHKPEFFAKVFCVMSMLTIWGSNFNLMAQNMTEKEAISRFLVSFPNYFLYAVAFTLLSYNGDDFYWVIIKWATFAISIGWLGASFYMIFK